MNYSEVLSHYWPFIIFYEIICALVSAYAARLKQRDQGNWFIIGLVFGVFSVAAAFAVTRRPDQLAPGNNLLLDKEHYLRSGWRVALFLVAVLIVYAIGALLAKLTGVVPIQSYLFLFYIVVLLVTYLMLKFVDRRRFISVGMPYHGRIVKEILFGFLLGALMICVVGAVELAAGAIKLHIRPEASIHLLLRNFALSFVFFAYFAMGEELIFRGYPFQALMEGTGAVGATILMSAFFGLAHMTNPDATILSTLNTMLAGAWLSVAYLKKRTLYFPFGMHFSWNLVQSFFLSLPVSGLLTNRTIFIPTDYGPYWLTGGKYGPEAGVCATVVLVAAIIYLLFEKRIRPSYDFVGSKERLAPKAPDQKA